MNPDLILRLKKKALDENVHVYELVEDLVRTSVGESENSESR
jgi:hypothetical protein